MTCVVSLDSSQAHKFIDGQKIFNRTKYEFTPTNLENFSAAILNIRAKVYQNSGILHLQLRNFVSFAISKRIRKLSKLTLITILKIQKLQHV